MKTNLLILVFTLLFIQGCKTNIGNNFENTEQFNRLSKWAEEQQCADFNLSVYKAADNKTITDVSCSLNIDQEISPETQIKDKFKLDKIYSEYSKYNQQFIVLSSEAQMKKSIDKSTALTDLQGKILLKQMELKNIIELSKIDSSKIQESYVLKKQLDEMLSQYNLALMYNSNNFELMSASMKKSKEYFSMYNVLLQDYADHSLNKIVITHSFNFKNIYTGSDIEYFFNEAGKNSKCVKHLNPENNYLEIMTINVDSECFENRKYF